jgi:hypothetical protein
MLLVAEEILLLGIKGPADRCLVRAQGTSLPPPHERLMQPTAWRRARFPQPEPPLPLFYPPWALAAPPLGDPKSLEH